MRRGVTGPLSSSKGKEGGKEGEQKREIEEGDRDGREGMTPESFVAIVRLNGEEKYVGTRNVR